MTNVSAMYQFSVYDKNQQRTLTENLFYLNDKWMKRLKNRVDEKKYFFYYPEKLRAVNRLEIDAILQLRSFAFSCSTCKTFFRFFSRTSRFSDQRDTFFKNELFINKKIPMESYRCRFRFKFVAMQILCSTAIDFFPKIRLESFASFFLLRQSFFLSGDCLCRQLYGKGHVEYQISDNRKPKTFDLVDYLRFLALFIHVRVRRQLIWDVCQTDASPTFFLPFRWPHMTRNGLIA